MNNNAREGLWLVVGGYLAYSGVKLIMDIVADRPDKFQMMLVFGVVFVIAGAAVVIRSLRNIVKAKTEDTDQDENLSEEDDNEEDDNEEDDDEEGED